MRANLKLPPGMVANGTIHDAMGRWREGNFVRWVEGTLQPVRPWTRITATPMPGRVCGLQAVRDNAQRRWLIVGTNEGLWLAGQTTPVELTPVDYNTGYAETEVGVGFGSGSYNVDAYGTPRDSATGISLEADNWHFDVWGEFVVGCSTGDGRALVWRPGTLSSPYDTEFNVIANAPIDNRALLVTNERHLMLIAADGNPRKVQWSAREDYEVWTPTALNLAGDLLLETAGTLQTGLKTTDGIIVLSEVDAFLIRYVGRPYGYGQQQVGRNCGIIGPHAGVATNDFVVWMGVTGFWVYNGRVQPIACDVWDFVFRELTQWQRAQIACGHNAEFHEIWWFFPLGDATRNTHYVIWNYRDNWWATGELSRTQWRERGVWGASLAAGSDGHIYEHERPFKSPGAARRPKPYVTSAPLEIGNGDQVMHVMSLIPDQECDSLNALSYTFVGRFAPICEYEAFGPYYPDESGFTDTRFTAREVQWTVMAEQDVSWRLGVLKAEIEPGGER